MRRLTLADLVQLMRECGGTDEVVAPLGDIVDAEFDAIGCDSITLLEVTGRIQREFGVNLVDDVLAAVRTPGELLGMVNEAIGDAATGSA
jgi:minimal PKS acyl carrier protein